MKKVHKDICFIKVICINDIIITRVLNGGMRFLLLNLVLYNYKKKDFLVESNLFSTSI